MVLNLVNVFQSSNKSFNIVVRNHRDGIMTFCPPNDIEFIEVNRWLDAGSKCTEVNITHSQGRSAAIQLEYKNWKLVVTGNIKDGRKDIEVGGGRNFDIEFTNDGYMRLHCEHGRSWGEGMGPTLEFVLMPFQELSRL